MKLCPVKSLDYFYQRMVQQKAMLLLLQIKSNSLFRYKVHSPKKCWLFKNTIDTRIKIWHYEQRHLFLFPWELFINSANNKSKKRISLAISSALYTFLHCQTRLPIGMQSIPSKWNCEVGSVSLCHVSKKK